MLRVVGSLRPSLRELACGRKKQVPVRRENNLSRRRSRTHQATRRTCKLSSLSTAWVGVSQKPVRRENNLSSRDVAQLRRRDVLASRLPDRRAMSKSARNVECARVFRIWRLSRQTRGITVGRVEPTGTAAESRSAELHSPGRPEFGDAGPASVFRSSKGAGERIR